MMQPSDRVTFVQRLVVLAELFGKPLSPAVQVLYFEALQDLAIEPVIAAMTISARTCTFMPKPAEIRVLVMGDTGDAVEAAWLTYKRLARAVGAYESPTFEDGAIGATLLAIFGSWEQACAVDLSPEMWVAKRREFERVYRVTRDRHLGPLTLDGFCARTNYALGYEAAAPANARLLGDGMLALRRRLHDASEDDRARWRQNVTDAIERRAMNPAPTPASSMEPLASIAVRVPIEAP